jgi:hypothetical protein
MIIWIHFTQILFYETFAALKEGGEWGLKSYAWKNVTFDKTLRSFGPDSCECMSIYVFASTHKTFGLAKAAQDSYLQVFCEMYVLDNWTNGLWFIFVDELVQYLRAYVTKYCAKALHLVRADTLDMDLVWQIRVSIYTRHPKVRAYHEA